MHRMLLLGLFGSLRLIGCWGESATDVIERPPSPVTVLAFPTALQVYHASLLIREHRRTHPSSSAGLEDRDIAQHHLRTKSRIVEPHTAALKAVA